MKKGIALGYTALLGLTLLMQSCQEDPISPTPGLPDGTDTTWVGDSTNNGGDPNGGGTGGDSTNWNGGGDPNGGGTGGDSTNWGGGGNPGDTL